MRKRVLSAAACVLISVIAHLPPGHGETANQTKMIKKPQYTCAKENVHHLDAKYEKKYLYIIHKTMSWK